MSKPDFNPAMPVAITPACATNNQIPSDELIVKEAIHDILDHG